MNPVCGFVGRVLCVLGLAFAGVPSAFGVEEGFYPPKEFVKNGRPVPANFDRAVKASFQIVSEMDDGVAGCSGALVSRDGHFLTAAHCIADCLLRAGVAEVSGSKNKEGLWETVRIKDRAPRDVSCARTSLLLSARQKVAAPKVVLLGTGFTQFDDRRALEIAESEMAFMARYRDDFAILKFDLPADAFAKGVSCLPPAAKAPALGERIWAIGFPGENQRPSGWASNGRSKYVSYGSVVEGVRGNGLFRKEKFSEALLSRLAMIYDQPGAIFSSMDIYPGDSGSPAINRDGELVGVNTSLMAPDDELASRQFVDNSGISLSLERIKKISRPLLGDRLEKEILSCR